MKHLIATCLFICAATTGFAQDTTSQNQAPISWMVFADVYYAYDFNRPQNHEKAPFLYNHKRHNEVNLNLALAQVAYNGTNVRGAIGLQAGTYPQYNYAAEQDLLKMVYQANVGVRLSRTKNLWLDAGILPAHIGYESAISKDNWTLTRSLMSENSPFFETALNLGYTSDDERWSVAGLIVTGWQRIRRVDGNQTPAFGTQLTFTPSVSATFNWSTFVGNEYPDSVRRWRYFNNLYTILQPTEKIGITLAFDIGAEQAATRSNKMIVWYTPNIVLRYQFNEQWAIAARGEYYNDEQGVLIGTGTLNGFKTWGASFNVDRSFGNHLWWRTELRTFNCRDAILMRDGSSITDNTFLTTSLAISF